MLQLWSALEYEIIFPDLNWSLGWPQQRLCCISVSVLTVPFWKCYHMCSIQNSSLGMLPLPHEPQVHWGCRNPKGLCWAFHLLASGEGKSRAEMPAGAAGQGCCSQCSSGSPSPLAQKCRTGRSSEESSRQIDGERKNPLQNPTSDHLEPELGLLMLKGCKKH